MRSFSFLPLLLLLVLLSGCPKEVDESIDDGSYTQTDWLVGKWTCLSGDDKGTEYTVTRDKTNKAKLISEETGANGDQKRYGLIMSTVGKNLFASVYELDGDEDDIPTEYFILKVVKKSNKEMQLWPVKETLAAIGTERDEMVPFLTAHGSEPATYDMEDVVTYRKK
jgi:hypothetical protein